MHWLEYSCAIQGWMHPSELTWLYEQAQGRKRIAEVGVWRGRSLSAMAAATDGEAIGIDSWDSTDCTYTQLAPMGMDVIRFEAEQNMAKFPNVRLIVGSSQGAAPQLADIDMLFIDGDHSYEGVKADLDALLPCCSSDALICGHDCGLPGVLKAVNERFGGHVEMGCVGSIWRALP